LNRIDLLETLAYDRQCEVILENVRVSKEKVVGRRARHCQCWWNCLWRQQLSSCRGRRTPGDI